MSPNAFQEYKSVSPDLSPVDHHINHTFSYLTLGIIDDHI